MADINQAQRKLLSESFLDQLGQDKTYELENLPLVQRLLVEAAAAFILNAKANIDNPDRRGRVLNSTGALSDGLANTPIQENNGNIRFDLGYRKDSPASEYFDFVNEGVRGIEDSSIAIGSPYSFKAAKGIRPGPSMRAALEKWIANNRQVITATKPVNFGKAKGQRNRAGAVASQSKKQALTGAELTKSIAYAIGTNIRKQGLFRTLFFDRALDQTFDNNFYSAVASVVGADISIGLRRLNSLSNE